MRTGTARIDDESFASEPSRYWPLVWNWLWRRPMDTIASIVAAFATTVILVNALFLQSGPHPAPIFANRLPVAILGSGGTEVAPSPRAAGVAAGSQTARSRTQVIADIQRELARRGFFEGPADGVYGPKTDSAVRDFEQAARLRPSSEPNDALLAAIAGSTVKAKAPPLVPKNDPIADLLAPSRRVVAVQRALSDFGYGPLKATGAYDAETRRAIERFERENKLPVTGQITDRLTRQLTVMTGRPLD
jgi:peptidoglycan hydrolase-like protein with peptidoglycan-binding domain